MSVQPFGKRLEIMKLFSPSPNSAEAKFYHMRLDHPRLMKVLSDKVCYQFICYSERANFMSFNKIIIVGNLGRDPELRYTPQGNAVCNFSIATNEKRRDKAGEMQDVTTWFRVTLWGKQAEVAAKYLTKGSSVYVEGRLRVEEWTDRDGNNRQTLDVNGSDIQFLGGGARNEGGYDRESPGEAEFAGPAEPRSAAAGESTGGGFTQPASSDDDIPF